MRTNGTLQYGIIALNTELFNQDGEPIAVGLTWSEEIPCSIKTVTNDSKGRYEDGKFDRASYEVLVETANLPIDITRVKLFRWGIDLGEFAVQGLPVPTTMNRIKIIV